MPKIFISYRRSDSADASGRLYDRLVERYGKESVFKDVDSIPAGVNFPEYIEASIQASNVAIIVIGLRWLDASSGWGRRRLDDPADFVRIEIETALRLGVPAIPVLIGGAQHPPVRQLPASLRPLLLQNGLSLRPDPDFHRDVDRVFAAIEYWQSQPRREPVSSTQVASPSTTLAEPAPGVAETTAAPENSQLRTQAGDTAPAARKKLKKLTLGMRKRAPLGLGLGLLAALLLISAIVTLLSSNGAMPLLASFSSPTLDTQATQQANAARATLTAQAALIGQPYLPQGGVGPCDTNKDEVATNWQSLGWSWSSKGVTCRPDKSTAILVGNVGSHGTYLTFKGFGYYQLTGFPRTFTVTMRVAFSAAGASGADQSYCMTVGRYSMYMSDPSVTICHDGSWQRTGYPQRTFGTFSSSVHSPVNFTITVTNSTISGTATMTIVANSKTLLSDAPFPNDGFEGEMIGVGATGSQPTDTISVSDFVLTPVVV